MSIKLAGLPAGFCPGNPAKPALLFLHGMMSRWQHFDQYMHYFSSRDYPCWSVSLRGRDGITSVEGVRFGDYLNDVETVMEIVDRPVILVGHSLGALLALKTAETALDVRGLILIAPAPIGHLRRPPLSALRLFVEGAPAVLTGRSTKFSLAALAEAAMPLVAPEVRNRTYSTMVPESGLLLRDLALGVPVATDRISCPVLCLSGKRDGICPPWLASAVAKQLRATSLTYEDHDHWFLNEPGWEEPCADVCEWLSKVDGGSEAHSWSRWPAHSRTSARPLGITR